MEWEKFIEFTTGLPVINTELLLAGVSNTVPIKVQISRWQKSGKLIQLKRGVYVLSDIYRKIDVYEPYAAWLLKKPSYISLEKALEYHNVIPEAVPVYTCVTTKRPAKFVSGIGTFLYRHIKTALFWGYESVTVNHQTGFIAAPEKALLDLVYLNNITASLEYFQELRLQNIEKIDPKRLSDYAARFKKPRILKAAKVIEEYIHFYREEEKQL